MLTDTAMIPALTMLTCDHSGSQKFADCLQLEMASYAHIQFIIALLVCIHSYVYVQPILVITHICSADVHSKFDYCNLLLSVIL